MGVFPKTVDWRVKPVEQCLVCPFKVEHQRDGLAHAGVLELFAPQVEDKALTAGNHALGYFFANDDAVGQTR